MFTESVLQNVHNNFIHNDQKVEIAQVSIIGE